MQLHPYHQAIIDANRAANRPHFHQLKVAAEALADAARWMRMRLGAHD